MGKGLAMLGIFAASSGIMILGLAYFGHWIGLY